MLPLPCLTMVVIWSKLLYCWFSLTDFGSNLESSDWVSSHQRSLSSHVCYILHRSYGKLSTKFPLVFFQRPRWVSLPYPSLQLSTIFCSTIIVKYFEVRVLWLEEVLSASLCIFCFGFSCHFHFVWSSFLIFSRSLQSLFTLIPLHSLIGPWGNQQHSPGFQICSKGRNQAQTGSWRGLLQLSEVWSALLWQGNSLKKIALCLLISCSLQSDCYSFISRLQWATRKHPQPSSMNVLKNFASTRLNGSACGFLTDSEGRQRLSLWI